MTTKKYSSDKFFEILNSISVECFLPRVPKTIISFYHVAYLIEKN